MRRLALILWPTLTLLACSDDGIVPELASGGGSTSSPTTANPGTGDGIGSTSNNGADTTTAEGGTTVGTTVGTTATTGNDTGEGDTGSTGSTDTGSTDTGSTDTGSTDNGSTGTGSTGTDTDTGSSDGGMMGACPEITGTSLIGGPADLYGYCWYITAPMDTCDSACSELAGGANLALLAESSYANSCNAPVPGDVPTWFFDNGNPAGWTAMGGTTSAHTLGYGYSIVGQFYGKCSTGPTSVGTYPGEAVGGGLESQRQLICACAEGTP